jgi:hypothetical protein
MKEETAVAKDAVNRWTGKGRIFLKNEIIWDTLHMYHCLSR